MSPTSDSELMLGGLPPPPGVTPNFVDPYNIHPVIYATLILCLSISTIFVWIRMYTVLRILKSHGWADYFSLMAWIGAVGEYALGLMTIQYGAGIHQWDVPLLNVSKFAQIANDQQILYGPLIFLTKISILLQFQKIFVVVRTGTTYYLIHILIWTNVLFYTANTIFEIWECTPRTKIWNPTIPGHCVNTNVTFILTATFNVVSDFLILVMPLSKIWNLQMPTRRKLGVSAIFAFGALACLSSVFRLVESITSINNEDKTFALIPVALWTNAEIACGIICGCLPVFPAFVRHTCSSTLSRLDSYALYARSLLRGSSKSNTAAALENSHDAHGFKRSYIELERRGAQRISQ